jgi:biotin synthase
VHRYNHNLETARSYFPEVVTTHTWEERWETLQLVRELRHGGVLRRHRRDGRDARAARRARAAVRRARARRGAAELPRPAPGTPFADLAVVEPADALRTIAAFRLALPRTILRFAGGRELTLGDLGARQGVPAGSTRSSSATT